MAGRPTTSFSLKQTLIMGFVPVLLLLLGCTLGSIYLNYDIHSHVSVLSTSASDKLRYVQHTAINLETVKQSLKTLSTTHDPEEAREAYVSTWELFSESALDRYEETREPLYQLLKDTRRAWLERQKADEAHDRFIEQYKEFYVHLIQTVALIGPRQNDRLTNLARNIVTTLEATTSRATRPCAALSTSSAPPRTPRERARRGSPAGVSLTSSRTSTPTRPSSKGRRTSSSEASPTSSRRWERSGRSTPRLRPDSS